MLYSEDAMAKLYDSDPLKTMLTDKYLVREWVAGKIDETYLFRCWVCGTILMRLILIVYQISSY